MVTHRNVQVQGNLLCHWKKVFCQFSSQESPSVFLKTVKQRKLLQIKDFWFCEFIWQIFSLVDECHLIIPLFTKLIWLR